MGNLPARIVSGGQTGVDRAALDAARALGIPHGGWCPKGRRAEDGPIPAEYALQETESGQYAVRTERNVLDADATLILSFGRPSGGTALTLELARRHGRPVWVADLAHGEPDELVAGLRSWLEATQVGVLNVAGPRASKHPQVYPRARTLLEAALRT